MNPFDFSSATYQSGALIADRYKVIRGIASGGQGLCYEVEHIHTGQQKVLKILHLELNGDPELRARTLEEAKKLGRLNHPNIVNVTDAGHTDDEHRLPFFVMDKLHGCTLQDVLHGYGQLDVISLVLVALDVSSALAEAHRQGHIHGDIKPDNLFIHHEKNSTRAIVLDFGIAVVIVEPGEAAEVVALTPAFASPEQLCVGRITNRSDIFALGVVMYVMLTGAHPFPGGDSEAHYAEVAANAERHAVPIASVRRDPGFPKQLGELVMQMLAKDPLHRPRDCAAVNAELKEICRDLRDAQGQAPLTLPRRLVDYIAGQRLHTNIPSGPKSIRANRAKKSVEFVQFATTPTPHGRSAHQTLDVRLGDTHPRPSHLRNATPLSGPHGAVHAGEHANAGAWDTAATDPDSPLPFPDRAGSAPSLVTASAPHDISNTDPGGAPLFESESVLRKLAEPWTVFSFPGLHDKSRVSAFETVSAFVESPAQEPVVLRSPTPAPSTAQIEERVREDEWFSGDTNESLPAPKRFPLRVVALAAALVVTATTLSFVASNCGPLLHATGASALSPSARTHVDNGSTAGASR